MSKVDPARPVDVMVDDEWVAGWLIGWDAARQVGTVRYTRQVELETLSGPRPYSNAAGPSSLTWEQGRTVEQMRPRPDDSVARFLQEHSDVARAQP